MEHGADPGGSASGTNEQRTEEPAEIDANGILALDGMQASQAELSRARVTAQFLEALLPSLVDDGDAAQALHDVAALRSYPLDDPGAALEAIRAAFARRPALHIARAYRKAAIRAGSLDDQLAALEGEIKLAPTPAYRATLETERGGLYERAVGNLAAARQSYAAAVEINPSDVTALLALLRLALRDGDRAAAAAGCKKIADAVGDPRVKAEFLAWAGRLYDAAGGQAEAALAAAVQGEVHAPDSPSVRFLLERLYAGEDNARELGAVVERGLRDGSVAASDGWFDLGYLYRYRLGDAERAEKAFAEVVAPAEAKAVALAELSELAAARGDWARVVALELERLDGERDATTRAATLARIGQVREERLDDADGAATAYTQAVEADASFLPALEGAGRVFLKRGTVDKLVWMHRAEAAAATSPGERAGALVRAGELLVADEATVDEGIAALEEARAALPTARAMFDALELALRRKGAYEKLATLYRTEVDRGVEARRAAWLLTQIGELAALRLNDNKRAIEAFSIAAGIEGDGPRFALSRLAQLLEDADEPAELEAVLARLGALTDDSAEQASLLERAARLQERRGDVEASLGSYRRALELAPAGHTVYAAAGRAFHRAERWTDLLTLFERAMLQGDAPERAHYAYRAGLLLARKLGRLDDGIELLHETIALDPKHRAARVALAALYTETGRWVELGPVLAELPPTPSLLARRAAIAEAGGRHEEALGLWQEAQAAGLATTATAQARLLARLGRWNELAELYERGSEPAAHGSNGSNGSANGTAGKQTLSSRYRAAELRLERLGQAPRAVELLAAAVAGEPDSVPLHLAHERALDDDGPARRDALKALVARTRDPALRVALLSQLASMLPEAEVVATRLNQMALSPRDPIITVRIEQTLESRRNREGLAALLRDLRRDPKSDPLLLASMEVQLGGLYEELGSLREAVDAFEAALAASPQPSLLARLALPRLYSALGDEARAAEALTRLAEALPAGAERAASLRKLAAYHRDRGDSAAAVATLESALQAHPRDYAALRALDILTFAGEPERLIDPLMRAFAIEPAGAQRSVVGTALAVRLLRANRMAPAREVLEQVLADDATHLNALVLGAELELRGEAWAAAAPALEAVAAHADAPESMAAEALRRLARVQLERLDDVAAARATATRLAAYAANDLSSLELRLVIAERADDHAEAAALLAALIAHAQLDDDRRAQLQLQLASLQEVKLDDAAAAIQTLGEIKLPARRRDAVDRLFDLGGRTNRWDLAASALEASLDRAGAMEPAWELAIRGRLANLLEGPLERRDAAVRQYERIVALDRGHVPALERLAELSAATAPDRAIEYHQALLATEPRRLSSYRALRQLFLTVGDEDAAFVTEALLEAVGVADEEEAYFYRQRRARLGGTLDGTLSEDERALLAPEAAAPAFALVHALGPALATVFPIDMAGYGVAAGDDGAVDAGLQTAARGVARLFGVEGYRLYAVPNRIGPAVEPGTPPALFVPRNLADASPREQQGVLGELMARVSFDAFLGDPRRLSPTTPALLEQLLWAACELSVPGCESPLRGRPVYEDIKRHLDKAAPARSEMAIAASRLLADGDHIGGEQILSAMNRVAVRATMLTSQDPATAIAYQLAHRGTGGGKGLDALPAEILAVLPFVVSRGHLAIRKRLGIGVHT